MNFSIFSGLADFEALRILLRKGAVTEPNHWLIYFIPCSYLAYLLTRSSPLFGSWSTLLLGGGGAAHRFCNKNTWAQLTFSLSFIHSFIHLGQPKVSTKSRSWSYVLCMLIPSKIDHACNSSLLLFANPTGGRGGKSFFNGKKKRKTRNSRPPSLRKSWGVGGTGGGTDGQAERGRGQVAGASLLEQLTTWGFWEERSAYHL